MAKSKIRFGKGCFLLKKYEFGTPLLQPRNLCAELPSVAASACAQGEESANEAHLHGSILQ